MKVRQIMTESVETVGPDAGARDVAARMRDHNTGAVLVVDAGRVVGIVTDRDIVVRMVADWNAADLSVRRIMSQDVCHCHADQDVADLAGLMGDHQVRRMPVFDDAGRLIGIVSLGDIAEHASEQLAGEALGEIVELR